MSRVFGTVAVQDNDNSEVSEELAPNERAVQKVENEDENKYIEENKYIGEKNNIEENNNIKKYVDNVFDNIDAFDVFDQVAVLFEFYNKNNFDKNNNVEYFDEQ